MNLREYMSDNRVKITETFNTLAQSIADAFQSRRDRWDADRVNFVLNGLTNLYLKLDSSAGKIKITLNGINNLVPYAEERKIDEKYPVYGVQKEIELKNRDLRTQEKKTIALSRVNLRSQWTIEEQKYTQFAFEIEVGSEIPGPVLADLVKLMELAGYIPAVKTSARYF